MRKLLAVWLGKILTVAGKFMGKKSSSIPGEYAMKICPDLIRNLNRHIKKGVIITCGTNGKTTTNNFICSALEAKGYKVLCNRIGANMLSGVATAFVQDASLTGKLEADYACFEIDEAYARIVFDYVKPDIMIITNLFRDQLDRYGEIEITSKLLKEAIAKAPNVKLVLNGDDPLCVQFGQNQNAFYYGVSDAVLPQDNTSKEGRTCPVCGAELEFNFHHYSQLGDFYCPSCDFKHPQLDTAVTDVSLKSPMQFSINGKKMTVNSKGFYNIYNFIAVYTALEALGENTDDFNRILSDFKPQIGRMQEFMLNKPVIMNLSKNPAGFNQAITTVNTDDRKKDVVIAVNDMAGDGRDVSWLWDVEFEQLKNDKLNSLSLSGARKWDLGLRFKYADIPVDIITSDMRDAITRALNSDSEVVYLIVNYTVMFPTEAILNDLLKERGNK